MKVASQDSSSSPHSGASPEPGSSLTLTAARFGCFLRTTNLASFGSIWFPSSYIDY